MWPGFSENHGAFLKWIVDPAAHGRAVGQGDSQSAGCRTTETSNWNGFGFFRKKNFDELQAFRSWRNWRDEVLGHEELFLDLHDRAAG